jgi:hypothetical protein
MEVYMIPDHETVKQIMNEVYNKFYLKWRRELTLDNIGQMMQEAYALEHKYDGGLCRHMIADLIECIENERRSEDEVN